MRSFADDMNRFASLVCGSEILVVLQSADTHLVDINSGAPSPSLSCNNITEDAWQGEVLTDYDKQIWWRMSFSVLRFSTPFIPRLMGYIGWARFMCEEAFLTLQWLVVRHLLFVMVELRSQLVFRCSSVTLYEGWVGTWPTHPTALTKRCSPVITLLSEK